MYTRLRVNAAMHNMNIEHVSLFFYYSIFNNNNKTKFNVLIIKIV